MKDEIILEIKNKLPRGIDLDNLENLLETEYKYLNVSQEIKDFVNKLVSGGKLPLSYLKIVNECNRLIGVRPINLKDISFRNLKNNLVKTINYKNATIFKTSYKEENNDDEVLSLDDTYIEKLRKTILNAQLNYLNNANSFIENLEQKDVGELYQTLLSLNDIRYIQHCVSKLNIDTLNKLLIYVDSLLKENSHNSINMFIKEAIKKKLHEKM